MSFTTEKQVKKKQSFSKLDGGKTFYDAPTITAFNAHTDLAKVTGELLFIFNDMSEPSLESEVYSKVGQTSRNLRGITQTKTINKDE